MVMPKPHYTELTGGNRTALVFPRGDAGALARRILELASDAGRAGRLVSAGLTRLSDRHAPDAIARAYEDIYRHVLTGTPIPEA